MAGRPGPVAFLLKGYPRLSETFIAQEILGLERAGLDIRIYSMRRPTDRTVHPIHAEIRAPVAYLPEYLHEAPGRVLRGWRRARRLPGYARARRAWLRDLRRDPTRNRVRRFGQALVLAAELPPEVARIHAHFIHTPGSVARYAGLLTGLPWSCSAHAKDIWTTPEWELRDKLAEVDWLVTCTRSNRDHLAALAADADRVALVYHGLDFTRFPPPAAPAALRDGTDPAQPVRLVSVGRAVPKKGFDGLLHALARLPDGLHWRWSHIGGGDRTVLERLADRLGVADRIEWHGAQAQQAVLAAYRDADLFVLPCRVADDGDRDGLPNVLMEAQSQALACVSTSVSGVGELIHDGDTGRLVPPDDPTALADAIAALARDPALRARLGRAGLDRVHAGFDFEQGLRTLAAKFGLTDAPIDAAAQSGPGRRCASPSTRRSSRRAPPRRRATAGWRGCCCGRCAAAATRRSWPRGSAATTVPATRRARPGCSAAARLWRRGSRPGSPPASGPDCGSPTISTTRRPTGSARR
jgi:glycosyltransferase involved in cell wall biosynthesis